MIDFLNGKVLEVTAFVRGASVLGAIVIVAATYYKARSLVALLVAALTAGVFLWTINNTEWWTDRVEEETDTLGRNTLVVTHADVAPVGAPVQVA
jgi:hypothetical protein